MINLCSDLNFTQDILDKAHDNYATYQLLKHCKIEPFIALKKTNDGNYKYAPPIEIDDNGVPICKAGFKMANWGYQKSRCRIKWRCPAKALKGCTCPEDEPCSPSSYGRVVYTKPDWDPRLFTPTPRDSNKWKKTMKKRSSSERRNSRVKDDYSLERDEVRSKSRWMIRTVMRDAALHADAWIKEHDLSAKEWVASWFSKEKAA